VDRTPLSDAFDFDFDFDLDFEFDFDFASAPTTDACSTVEERHFTAASSAKKRNPPSAAEVC
jgi:hypothetical protein